jgi:hypothetical protein
MVALIVILFPPLLIAFLLIMERVEEPLRRPTTQREVEEFLGSATPGEVDALANSGIRRAMARWRQRRSSGRGSRISGRRAMTDRGKAPVDSGRPTV